MKLSKSPDIKISLHQGLKNVKKMKLSKSLTKICVSKMFKKMKLSKSPDIKISLHGRSQKCVFKKMKLCSQKKSPDIKIFLTHEGLKNVCSKNETLKKS